MNCVFQLSSFLRIGTQALIFIFFCPTTFLLTISAYTLVELQPATVASLLLHTALLALPRLHGVTGCHVHSSGDRKRLPDSARPAVTAAAVIMSAGVTGATDRRRHSGTGNDSQVAAGNGSRLWPGPRSLGLTVTVSEPQAGTGRSHGLDSASTNRAFKISSQSCLSLVTARAPGREP